MKWGRRYLAVAIALIVATSCWIYLSHHEDPRRDAIRFLTDFQFALSANDTNRLLHDVLLPAPIKDRTDAVRLEFIKKSLSDEISLEGITVLARNGLFGPLLTLFPGESERWAALAGVSPTNCVAFKMTSGAITAEVVLVCHVSPERQKPSFRIFRCNNVAHLNAPHSP